VGRLLTDTYGYEGGEKHLRSLGVILGEDLSAWKARIKLIVLLSAGLSPTQIRREFEHRFYD
jgi:L-asparaginase